MKFDKNDSVALIGTILVHLAIGILLFFCVLKTTLPEEEEGVLVNFGNVNLSAGVFEPQGRTSPRAESPVSTPEVLPPPSRTTPKEEMVTQDTEETVSLTEKKKDEERKRREEAERKEREAAERQRQEEQRQKAQAINERAANAFGSGNATTESQGDGTTGAGNQGSPFGNSDTGANEGVGGFGTFNLSGRSLGAGGLPRPAYTNQEEGRIVVNITVDSKGNVIFAEIGRGTNIDNTSMRNSAIDAAKKAKFNKITGTNNQTGTITYIYKLK